VFRGADLVDAFIKIRSRLFGLEAQLEIARDLHDVGPGDAEELLAMCERVRRSLSLIIFRLSR